jgi:hypothetical protein
MTPSEAFMATQTKVLRQILQTQQQIAQQMNRGPPHGANHKGHNQVTTYAQFIGMKPPTFSKTKDPMETEAWIKAIEAKFSTFVMPCSEENKVLTDKRRIPLRSASVRTPHLFHHGIPKVLVNPRSKGITSVRSTTTH